jgi:4-amino-4-deoxy-L-arabinose transferase-like glycosyltransferase
LLRSEHAVSDPGGGPASPVRATIASRLYRVLALFPLLPLLLILIAQVIFSFDARPLWCGEEARIADLFESVGRDPSRWALLSDGTPWSLTSPLYFWLLYVLTKIPGLSAIPGLASPASLLFFGSAVSGLLLLLAAYALFRLVTRLDGRGSLAAGILLLGCVAFSTLLHAVQMDVFFAALVTASHVFLYHAWVRRRAWLCMALGFAFAAAAALVMGPLGLLLPLVSGLFFILWTGRVTRFFRPDFLLGLIIGLGLPAAWVCLVMRETGQGLDGGFVQSALAFHKAQWLAWGNLAGNWYGYLAATAVIWLPWTLLLFFLPWGRLFSKATFSAIGLSRKPRLSGVGYMWCMLFGGLVPLSLMSVKPPLYALCLTPPLAALFGRAVLRLSPRASGALKAALSVLLCALGLALLIVPLLPVTLPFLPVLPRLLYFAGGVALICACLMAFLVNARRPEGILLVVALFTAAFAYPFWTLSVPTLDGYVRGEALETPPAVNAPAPAFSPESAPPVPAAPDAAPAAPIAPRDVPQDAPAGAVPQAVPAPETAPGQPAASEAAPGSSGPGGPGGPDGPGDEEDDSPEPAPETAPEPAAQPVAAQ